MMRFTLRVLSRKLLTVRSRDSAILGATRMKTTTLGSLLGLPEPSSVITRSTQERQIYH